MGLACVRQQVGWRSRALTRPFVFINCAMSIDGKISSVERRQVRISSQLDLARVEGLRAKSDAIMVGLGTVLADDPKLRIKSEKMRNARLKRGLPENPLRIIADSQANTPPSARVLGDGCLLAVAESAPKDRLNGLQDRCEIIVCGREQVDLAELFSRLFERGIKCIMVEGGATLNWSLISLGLVDEIYVYMGAMLIGGAKAPTMVDGLGFKEDFPGPTLLSVQQLDEGVLLKWAMPKYTP